MDTSAVTIDSAKRSVRIEVDLDVHGRDAVFGAAYVFIDRCYVWLDKTDDGNMIVQLSARGDDTALEDLAGEFGNELLAQSTRAAVYARSGDLIQAIVNRALVGAGAGGTSNVLHRTRGNGK